MTNSGTTIPTTVAAATRLSGKVAVVRWDAAGYGVYAAVKEAIRSLAEQFIAAIPAGRVGDPVADIGRAVARLCTSEAS